MCNCLVRLHSLIHPGQEGVEGVATAHNPLRLDDPRPSHFAIEMDPPPLCAATTTALSQPQASASVSQGD